jgi:glucose-6-phosphate dehydrogenase assembly protein OpcA
VGVVAEVERSLARQRCADESGETGELRASTMTHVVWCPPNWLREARRTLDGLAEQHPARTIFLVPERGKRPAVEARAELKDFEVPGLSRTVVSEVIEVTLRGAAAEHPASVMLPLLLSDLPAFCRWRGSPVWGSRALDDVARVCDRLVVDSGEWTALKRGLEELPRLFDHIAVSDIAFARSLPWRARLAERWPEVAAVEQVLVAGPRADAYLLAGWLRSRLGRDVRLTRRAGDELSRVRFDGNEVSPSHAEAPGASELLSAELDRHARDPVYEAAVRAA